MKCNGKDGTPTISRFDWLLTPSYYMAIVIGLLGIAMYNALPDQPPAFLVAAMDLPERGRAFVSGLFHHKPNMNATGYRARADAIREKYGLHHLPTGETTASGTGFDRGAA